MAMAPKFDSDKVLKDLKSKGQNLTADEILRVLENSAPVDDSAPHPAPKGPESPNIELDTAMNFFKVNRRA